MNHLVFLDTRAGELERILSGMKTMLIRESDPARTTARPVNPGDSLYFLRDKDDCAVRVQATVVRILHFTNSPDEDLSHTLKEWQPRLQLTEDQYNYWSAKQHVLLVGAIWAVWHWPYVFMGYEYWFNYWGAPVVGPLLWVVVVCLLSTFLTWVTLRSGSVWPAAISHGVINALASLMLYFTRGEPKHLIGPGPVGIIGSLGYAMLAVLIFFSARALAQPAPAPVDMALAENPGALGKVADQAKLGTAS